jgi:hypothetical protein
MFALGGRPTARPRDLLCRRTAAATDPKEKEPAKKIKEIRIAAMGYYCQVQRLPSRSYGWYANIFLPNYEPIEHLASTLKSDVVPKSCP